MPVYFIQRGDDGPVKIGLSKDAGRRLKGLQTNHDAQLHIRRVFVGGAAEERALHERFAALRLKGEWFRPAEEILSGDLGLVEAALPDRQPRAAVARAARSPAEVLRLLDAAQERERRQRGKPRRWCALVGATKTLAIIGNRLACETAALRREDDPVARAIIRHRARGLLQKMEAMSSRNQDLILFLRGKEASGTALDIHKQALTAWNALIAAAAPQVAA